MTAKITIAKPGGGAIDLTSFTGRKGAPFIDGQISPIQLGMRFANGEASQGSLMVMDPEAEIPATDLSYVLPGHKLITFTEDASGTEIWLARGRLARAESGRGVAKAANQVEFDVTFEDCNVDLRHAAFSEEWERPAETAAERLYALAAYCLAGGSSTATVYRADTDITISDSHLAPSTGSVAMAAKTYPVGTDPQTVAEECRIADSRVYGVVIHHTGGSHLCMLYVAETDHTTYTTPVKISDQVSDWDPDDASAPVVEPIWDQGKATLWDPQSTISGLVSVWSGGSVYVTNPTAESYYGHWVDTYYDADATTEAEATANANGLLAYGDITHLTHRVSIVLAASQVHLIAAGMSIQIKAAAALGGTYLGTWQTRRIAECKFEPRADGKYFVRLSLDRVARSKRPSPGKAQPAATTPHPAPPSPTPSGGTALWSVDYASGDDSWTNACTATGGSMPTSLSPWTSALHGCSGMAGCAHPTGWRMVLMDAGQRQRTDAATAHCSARGGDGHRHTSTSTMTTARPATARPTTSRKPTTSARSATASRTTARSNSWSDKTFILTPPAGSTMLRLKFSFDGAIQSGSITENATTPDTDPYAIDNPGTSPYFARSDDPRFTADDEHKISKIIRLLTNNSGGDLTAGAVVVLDDTGFTTTSTAASAVGMVGILLADTTDGSDGYVQFIAPQSASAIPAGVTGASADDYLFTSSTPGEATADATRAAGAFGRILAVDGSGVPTLVELWGVPDGSGASTTAAAATAPSPVVADFSNPPTELEIEAAIDYPSNVAGQTYVLQDSSTGRHYAAVSDGLAFQVVPLVASVASALSSELVASGSGGAMLYLNYPSAVYYNGVTYFGYVSGATGNVEIRTYTHATGVVSSATVLHSALEVDAHDSPAILIRDSDHKVVVVYCKHADSNEFYLRISSSAESIAAFGTEVNLHSSVGATNYTYPSIFQLTGESSSPIYIFFRDDNSVSSAKWSYTKSTDDGSTWSAITQVYSVPGARAYCLFRQTSTTRIDALADEANPAAVDNTPAVHFYYEAGAWHTSDGTVISASLPFSYGSCTEVYDGSGGSVEPADIGVNSAGHLVVAFGIFLNPTPSSGSSCYYGVWDGSAWTTHLVAADARYMAIDPAAGDVVYLVDNSSTDAMYKYTATDEGVAWTAELVHSPGSGQVMWPNPVKDHAADLKVMWPQGTYTTYTAFTPLSIRGSAK